MPSRQPPRGGAAWGPASIIALPTENLRVWVSSLRFVCSDKGHWSRLLLACGGYPMQLGSRGCGRQWSDIAVTLIDLCRAG